MDLERCKLKIYDIKKIGLYDYKEHKKQNNNIEIFMSALSKFLCEKSFINTKMEKSTNTNIYCYDIKELNNSKGEYVIVLWLAANDADSKKIISISKDNILGQRASNKKNKNMGIVGTPAYFYFSSKHEKIVMLEYKGSSADSCLIEKYLKSYINNFSPFADHNIKKDEKLSSGLRYNKAGALCYFSFEINRFINKSIENELIQNYKYIKHLITRSKIEVCAQTSSDLIKLTSLLKYISSKKTSTTIKSKVTLSVPVEFNKSELENYINAIKGTEEADKVGFVLEDEEETKTLYLNNSQAKETVKLSTGKIDVNNIPVWPYTAQDIINCLNDINHIEDFIIESSKEYKIALGKREKNKKNVGGK